MGLYTTIALDAKSYKALVDTIRSGYTYEGITHKPNEQVATILVLEANLGCRIGDIVALRTDSIIRDGGIWKLNITEQKTGKNRYFIVPPKVKAYIDDWTRKQGITAGRIFSIECAAVWKQLRSATGYLGMENVSSHSLRKYCANRLYESTGHDIEAVCAFLNHASTSTTRKYIRRTDAQLEKAISQTVALV